MVHLGSSLRVPHIRDLIKLGNLRNEINLRWLVYVTHSGEVKLPVLTTVAVGASHRFTSVRIHGNFSITRVLPVVQGSAIAINPDIIAILVQENGEG